MPSDQERSEPTPAEVALNALYLRALDLHDSIKAGEGATGWNDVLCRAILTRLVEATERAAKRDALLSVVRAGCRYCAESGPTLNASALTRSARWIHMEGKYLAFCEQPAVHDALSALESSGEAK